MPKSDRHCPFLNSEDSRCAEHQTLGKLDQTFRYCLSAFRECPAYAQISLERKAHKSARANALVVARQNIVQVTVTARPRVGVWRRLARMILPKSFGRSGLSQSASRPNAA